ncbi:sugar-phosphatase [Haloactinospora alba]|uniref:Sugar-phosphatase n=1 Tax=Haloactinospora alba TaxID=405555 RepID=A0A543NF63_9ACTN|nr:HAD family phosphatase [Haloactinospora alba]TQN30461.1 sugar-phosphatase [Haloactinospora alba]
MRLLDDNRPRAALFDLDGTLINSEPRSLAVWSRLLGSYGVDCDETRLRRLIGRRGADVFRDDPDVFPSGVPWETLVADLERIHRQPDLPPVLHLPESVDFVRKLHAEGVPLGLVTSAGRDWARLALTELGIDELFATLVTAADVTTGKPDPQGYEAGARALGYAPEHVVVFEDAPAGVAAGKRAGMRVVGITTTHEPETLSSADLIVDQLTEVDWPRIAPRSRQT